MTFHLSILVSTIWLTICLPVVAAASTKGEICDTAARHAASQTGVPLAVLMTITRVETGRKINGALSPWPWAVNMEGKGVWFANKSEALAFAKENHKQGARSFDVGCFQLNYRWHHDGFLSLEHMFDPTQNARYAAEFLNDLYFEFGDWAKAAGAYHSRTPNFARKYQSRFERILPTVDDQPKLAKATMPPVRENNFPLLQGVAQTSALGSLMPSAQGAAQPFWGS